MKNNEQHINDLLKQKFEGFAPQPPAEVWEGIAAALDKEVVPLWYHKTWVKVFALLLGVVIFSGILRLLTQTNDNGKFPDPVSSVNTETPVVSTESDNYVPDKTTVKPLPDKDKKPQKEKVTQNNQPVSSAPSDKVQSAYVNTTGNSKNISHKKQPEEKQKSKVTVVQSKKQTPAPNRDDLLATLNAKTIELTTLPLPLLKEDRKQTENEVQKNKPHRSKNGNLALGFYFTPGFVAADYDSLTIQNGYAINIKPVYYINDHWFIRPGIGVQYSRDKGFVKADYMSWDLLGSYEDVIDVTFDTVNGEVIPLYHTQKTDVYDSIRHITLSEETNRYLYLNTSLVFGYHNHKGKLGWSFYAGGGVNFVLYNKRDLPVEEDVTYISLKYNLPERHSPQYLLTLGAGVDYAIAKKWLVTVEPEYRYFINGINGGGKYNDPLSGIGLRFGFVYTLK